LARLSHEEREAKIERSKRKSRTALDGAGKRERAEMRALDEARSSRDPSADFSNAGNNGRRKIQRQPDAGDPCRAPPLNGMTAAREMYGKSYFLLGTAKRTEVIQRASALFWENFRT